MRAFEGYGTSNMLKQFISEMPGYQTGGMGKCLYERSDKFHLKIITH